MAQEFAYDFSLFGPYDDGSAAPQREPEFEPRREDRPKRPSRKQADKPAGKKAEKKAAVVTKEVKIVTLKSVLRMGIAFIVLFLVFSAVCIPMYLNVKLDETAREIASVQHDISVATSEHTRLSSALEGMVSIDKVEKYAENNLGMVKLENYRITYFNADSGDQVVISGGKSYKNNDSDNN